MNITGKMNRGFKYYYYYYYTHQDNYICGAFCRV